MPKPTNLYNWVQHEENPAIYFLRDNPDWTVYNSSGTYYLRHNNELLTDHTNIWEAMAAIEQYFSQTES